jgi:hypothetical protein
MTFTLSTRLKQLQHRHGISRQISSAMKAISNSNVALQQRKKVVHSKGCAPIYGNTAQGRTELQRRHDFSA